MGKQKNTRKFGQKRYNWKWASRSKPEIIKRKNTVKQKGSLARVTKAKGVHAGRSYTYYDLWTRKK